VSQTNPCLTSLTAGASLPSNPAALTYNSGTTTSVVLTDSRVIYTDAYSSVCPTPTCTLKASDCTTAYSAGRLTISGSSTWPITAFKNVIVGYSDIACISCTNGYDI